MDLYVSADTKRIGVRPYERRVNAAPVGLELFAREVGTLVLPEVVVDSATGSEHRPAPLGEGTPHGKMWTTDELNTDLDVIAGLRADGVVSLDMETAAIAESCEKRSIPWSVFRVISDRATDGSVDEEVFHLSNQDGTPNPRAIARYFLLHPQRI